MTEHLINPAGAHIRKIEIHYYIEDGYGHRLEGLRLFDKDNNTLLDCGEWRAPSSN